MALASSMPVNTSHRCTQCCCRGGMHAIYPFCLGQQEGRIVETLYPTEATSSRAKLENYKSWVSSEAEERLKDQMRLPHRARIILIYCDPAVRFGVLLRCNFITLEMAWQYSSDAYTAACSHPHPRTLSSTAPMLTCRLLPLHVKHVCRTASNTFHTKLGSVKLNHIQRKHFCSEANPADPRNLKIMTGRTNLRSQHLNSTSLHPNYYALHIMHTRREYRSHHRCVRTGLGVSHIHINTNICCGMPTHHEALFSTVSTQRHGYRHAHARDPIKPHTHGPQPLPEALKHFPNCVRIYHIVPQHWFMPRAAPFCI
jgi:hypothetical protein